MCLESRWGGTLLQWTSIPFSGRSNTSSRVMVLELELSTRAKVLGAVNYCANVVVFNARDDEKSYFTRKNVLRIVP